MRTAAAIASLSLACLSAYQAFALPRGWKILPDGTYLHVQSDVRCPNEYVTLRRVRVSAPPTAPVVGVCEYEGRYRSGYFWGVIRIRYHSLSFVRMDRSIKNEVDLLEQESDTSPTLGYIQHWERTRPDGQKLYGESFTIRRGKILIDCEEEGTAKQDHRALGFGLEMCRDIQRQQQTKP